MGIVSITQLSNPNQPCRKDLLAPIPASLTVVAVTAIQLFISILQSGLVKILEKLRSITTATT